MDRVERTLDRLTERHAALAQTVEIIAGKQRENEVRHGKNEVLLAQTIEAIHSLARIAESHERRLNDLEQ
jgi:hypothetical protein